MKKRSSQKHYVVCIDNTPYRASLVVRRIYQVLPDPAAQSRGLLRVVDESGEDYLFPQELFAAIEIPKDLSRALSRHLTRR